jgi:hypothetical protein
VTRISRDGSASPRAARDRGDDVGHVGTSGAGVERTPQIRIQSPQCRRAESAAAVLTTCWACRRCTGVGHRSDHVEAPAGWALEAVGRHKWHSRCLGGRSSGRIPFQHADQRPAIQAADQPSRPASSWAASPPAYRQRDCLADQNCLLSSLLSAIRWCSDSTVRREGLGE